MRTSTKVILFIALLLVHTTAWSVCTATKQNADYSEVGSGTVATLTTGGGHTAAVNAVGDLVVFFAWCYQNCTPGTLTMGSQAAILANSSPGTVVGGDGLHTGQAFIYYILSAAASGSQTITFNASGGASQTQVSYIDFTPSSGCTFTHHLDSSVGSGTGGGTANTPSISGVTGDILFNAVTNTQHVDPSVNSPWSCPAYTGSGETQTCAFNTTQNGAAYILSASSGSISTNWGLINSSTGWESIISSFSMTQLSANQCPSGLPITGNNCYFIAANGSDSNSGAYESSPWLHSWGMPTCSGNCLSSKPADDTVQAGKGLIFRGGDTWHFGNSSASPYTGLNTNCDGAGDDCGFHIAWSGTSISPFYVGVDQTWFSGTSWARPIFTGDNTPGIGACTYDQSHFSLVMQPYQVVYTIFDNFEFTGLCWGGSGAGSYYLDLRTSLTTTNRIIKNVYAHGYRHVAFDGSNFDGGTFIVGTPHLGFGDVFDSIVCDGQDSDHQSFFCIFGAGWDVHNSIFRYVSNGIIVNNGYTLHDNLFEFIQKTSDGATHGNVVEYNEVATGPNAFYNNVFRSLWTEGCAGEVLMADGAYTNSTGYSFNNLVYGSPCGGSNYWNQWSNENGQIGWPPPWTKNVFNNTFVISDATAISGPPTGTIVNFDNNHCITPSGGTAADCSSYPGHGTENYATTINQSTATATGQGYTSAQTYAYSPATSGLATTGTGTNRQTYCSALSSAGMAAAATACQSDTTYACSYNTSNHTPTCPARAARLRPVNGAWDIGAYQYEENSSAPAVSLDNSTLTFGSQQVGTSSSSQRVVLTNSGSATLNITSITASGDFSRSTNCGATVAASATCNIDVTFTPTTVGAKSGSVSIVSDAATSPDTVSLSGTGAALRWASGLTITGVKTQ